MSRPPPPADATLGAHARASAHPRARASASAHPRARARARAHAHACASALACAFLSALLAACSDTPTGAGPGFTCAAAPAPPCEPDLVCLDNVCRARPDAQSPAAIPLPPSASFDIVLPDPPDIPDIVEDTSPPEPDLPPPERLLIGDFDDTQPSDTRLGLAPGQAAAREVLVPAIATLELVRLRAWNPGPTPACGRFRATLWPPRAVFPEGGATFAITPDFIGPEQLVVAAASELVSIELPFAPLPPIAGRAPYRFGALYEGPCEGATTTPFVLLDASGDATTSFVWAETWVPGDALELPGRWGLQLGIRVDAP